MRASRTAAANRLPPIATLNALDRASFEAALRALFEHAPLLIARLGDRRPFASYGELLWRSRALVAQMNEMEKIAVLNAHPRIGERREALSELSRREQGRASPAEVERELNELNAEYEQRFGFRFVVFVNRRPKDQIIPVLRTRLGRSREDELAAGLSEFLAIAADRLRALR